MELVTPFMDTAEFYTLEMRVALVKELKKKKAIAKYRVWPKLVFRI
jgi:hypothetical protein